MMPAAIPTPKPTKPNSSTAADYPVELVLKCADQCADDVDAEPGQVELDTTRFMRTTSLPSRPQRSVRGKP